MSRPAIAPARRGCRSWRRPQGPGSAPGEPERADESMTGASPRARGEDEFEVLMRQAVTTRLLSSDEETKLAMQIERGDLGAKGRMVESNLRLVFWLARSYRGRGVPFADLVQEGTIGLVRAAERFDHRRGLKFSTYAIGWFRRSLIEAVAGSGMIR